MALNKNIASQKVAVFAWDSAAGTPKTGDAANITAQISKDGAATAASDDTNPTELDATDAPGIYLFDLTQAETNCDLFILYAASVTADINIEPMVAYTASPVDTASIADAVWDEARAGHTAGGTYGETLVTVETNIENLDAAVSSRSAAATALTDVTWTDARAGYLDELAAANIPADLDNVLLDTAELQTDDYPTSIAAVQTAVDALNDLSAAQVNAEVVDALNVDTYAEPELGAPGATISLAAKIGYMYKAFRNKITQTSTILRIYNDAGDIVDHKATTSDNGELYTRGKIDTGA